MVGRLRRPHVLGGSSHGMDIRPDVRAAGGVRVGATLVVARPLVRCVLLNVRAGGQAPPLRKRRQWMLRRLSRGMPSV